MVSATMRNMMLPNLAVLIFLFHNSVAFACAVISTFTASVGMAGIIRKSRRLLGIYSLLLWPCFALLCAVGYLGYKHDTWNLKAKLGMQWRYSLNDNGRITIQNNVS
jgi:hypothetical protein